MEAQLELLPTEVLWIIVELFSPREVRPLSCVSKRLREVCLPLLFYRAEFQFSKAGLLALESFLTSDVRHHVVSFTYVLPMLLKTDISDFDHFKSNVLTPENYVEDAKDWYDEGQPADDHPQYMVIYDVLSRVCEEQRDIVDKGIDLTVLSSALAAFPQLTKLTLCFCKTIEKHVWLESYLDPDTGLDVTMFEKSYEHHTRVVANAVRNARDSGFSIHAMHLSGFQLPCYDQWKVPDPAILSEVSETLRELLDGVQILRLSSSESVLELLSHSTLNLCQFYMCRLTVEYAILKGFLEANIKSLCTIGFHDVTLTGVDPLGIKLLKLSSELLCGMVEVTPLSILCRVGGCECLSFQDMGWSLLLCDDNVRIIYIRI